MAIPMIIGLMETAKDVGMNTVWATPLEVGIGLAIYIGWVAAHLVAGSEVWVRAVP